MTLSHVDTGEVLLTGRLEVIELIELMRSTELAILAQMQALSIELITDAPVWH